MKRKPKPILLTELSNWATVWTRYHAAPLDLSMCKDVARIEDGDAVGIKPDGQIQFLSFSTRGAPHFKQVPITLAGRGAGACPC